LFSIFKRKPKEAVQEAQVGEPSEGKPAAAFIETYPIYEPYVHAAIERDPTGFLRYIVIEPELTDDEKQLMDQIKNLLKITLDVSAKDFQNDDKASAYLRQEVIRALRRFDIKVRRSTFDKLMYYIVRDSLRYGPIDAFMRDPSIEDISCDGPMVPIYVWHRDFESIASNVAFPDKNTLDKFVMRLAYLSGRHMSIAQPLIDAGLPDGSRIQMTFGSEVTKKGSTFTIRRFKDDPFSIIDLLKFKTMSSEMAALLWFVLENKGSVLMAGGTASGKTTTINCLAMFIRPESKVVTIEDTPEVNIPHSNWIQSISRQSLAGVGEITLYDLLRAALRQRPDFIIVGEIRGAEASTLFQAISTGHAGISSVHADSVPAVLRRLVSDPMNIPRTLVPAVNIVLYQERITLGGKSVRRIRNMTEIIGLDPRTNEFILNDAYTYSAADDAYRYSGRTYALEKIAATKNLSADATKSELADRKLLLEWMLRKNIRKYRQVSEIVGKYYTDKQTLMNEVRIDAF
jgi:flagellar protein FlaI